jgi:hypoxanthine phosphoribosyltransferase
MSNVILNGHSFKVKITAAEIKKAVTDISKQINKELKGQNPLFVVVLNGAFIFAADLFKQITLESDISFIKIASYRGSKQGEIKELIGLTEDIKNRTVVIVEDIVDTGNTIDFVYKSLKEAGAKDVKIAALLFKAGAYTKDYPIDYTAIVASTDFMVGYGLDYNGMGRNLPDIYVMDYDADKKLKTKNIQ